MAEKIPADLKEAYAAEKKARGEAARKRAKSIRQREMLDEANVATRETQDAYLVAREEVRRLERQYDIGEWTSTDVPPTVIGVPQEEN